METARGLADLIEKDLEALTASLQTVAVSPRLPEGDLAGFHRVASEAARIHRLPSS
jgi:hypothetical protein